MADGTILLLNRKELWCSHQVSSSSLKSWNQCRSTLVTETPRTIDWATKDWFPSEKVSTGVVSSSLEIEVTLTWLQENKEPLLKDLSSIEHFPENQRYWVFTRLSIDSFQQTEEEWSPVKPEPKVKHASHVNETVTRLTQHKPQPSLCHTKHFTASAAAFLLLVPQQTSAFTLRNVLTCRSQSLCSQSALFSLFDGQDRTTHTLQPWPAPPLLALLLRCLKQW